MGTYLEPLSGGSLLYLALYGVTLVLHFVAVGYVVVGTALVFGNAVTGGKSALAESVLDWLPFALGVGITAGVAPLLFVQLVYREAFYTAHLLLHHRVFATIPILVVGFYGIYLAKSRFGCSARRRGLASGIALVCFIWVAALWGDVHSVSLERGDWARFYVEENLSGWNAYATLRAGVWLLVALTSFATLAAWQCLDRPGQKLPRRLMLTGLAGQTIVLLALWTNWPLAVKGLVATGLIGQFIVWLRHQPSRALSVWISMGSGVVATVGWILARENRRLEALLASIRDTQIGHGAGLELFAAFVAINGALLVWCVRAIRKELR